MMLPVEYYKYTHGILLSHKKNNNKILPLARTWMYLEVIMVSEMVRNYVRNIYIYYI